MDIKVLLYKKCKQQMASLKAHEHFFLNTVQ